MQVALLLSIELWSILAVNLIATGKIGKVPVCVRFGGWSEEQPVIENRDLSFWWWSEFQDLYTSIQTSRERSRSVFCVLLSASFQGIHIKPRAYRDEMTKVLEEERIRARYCL